MRIISPEASAERIIHHLPVFARAEYTAMLGAIDARARSQIAAAYAARFSWLASNLADLASNTADPDARRRITDLGAMAAESAEQAMTLSRQKARVEADEERQPDAADQPARQEATL